MKASRKRTIPAAVAIATLGVAATGVACTGSKAGKNEPASKTSGPAIAKSDKTVAAPAAPKAGATPAAPAAPAKPATPAPATPAVTAKPAAPAPAAPAAMPTARADENAPPPKPGAPLPPPKQPKPLPSQPTAQQPPKAPAQPAAPTPPKAPTAPAAPTQPTAQQPAPPKAPTPAPLPPTAKQPDAPKAPTAPTAPTAPKAPTAPAQPVVVKAPESEADRLLRQRIQELQLHREKAAVLVGSYLDQAKDAAAANDWPAVENFAAKAVELDNNNEQALRYWRQARAAQGDGDSELKSASDIMIGSRRVKSEQAVFTARTSFERAAQATKDGDHAAAVKHLEMARTAILTDPTGIEWGDLPKKVDSALAAAIKSKAQADDDARKAQAAKAYREVKAQEAQVRLSTAEKRNALMRSAMDAFEANRFAESTALLTTFVEQNPNDSNAKDLLRVSTRAMHNQASEDTLRNQRERFAEWRLDMQETTVPYHKILTWPSQEHWNDITNKRKDAGTISETVAESPETAATKSRLKNDRTNFNFSGTPFKEVISFLASSKGLNIVIDSEIAPELDSVSIALALQDITVENALRTLNKIAGNYVYVVQGSVVMITKPEKARAEPSIKVHSVGDLTVPVTNFVAGNLQLIPAGAEENEDQPRFGKSTEGIPSFGGAEELAELIKKNVASEEYWTSDGVNCAASGTDKLLVIAEPDVQRQVARFLDDLRQFSGLIVTIETRFLSVTDNFLRDVGVDIRGIGQGTPGRLALLDDVTNGLEDQASAGFDNNGPGLPAGQSGRPSSGAFFNNNSDGDYRGRTENVFDRALGSKISNIGGAVVQWTLVDDLDLSLILRAVEKTQEGRVLQAPSVTVYNTQRANITLINQLTYIQDFDVEVAQTAFIADPVIGIIQDGLVLDVQPTVSHDRKYITLTLRPTVANLVRPIPTFTTSLGAFTTPVTIQIPELKIQSAATTVRVPDGGTLLMGGLKTINMADLRAETPFFSSIPFASFFFGRKGTVKEMDNLMVIVKATITDLQAQERQLRR